MGEFFGSIYCWFEDFFGLELAEYMWGSSSPLSPNNSFIGIGFTMFGISLAMVLVYYYVVNHPRLNNWWGWLIFLGINAIINFIVGWQWVLKDYYDNKMVTIDPSTNLQVPLNIGESEILCFGVSNMILSILAFIIFSFIFNGGVQIAHAPHFNHMSKIFVFGIGGTGSRVLRSLTMMLASGVKFGADEIVPIIIDPDTANADLTRTVSLLNNYSSIRQSLNFSSDNQSNFFRTEIEQIHPNYTLRINDTDDKSFQQFIEYASMSKANKALAKMLFSDKNLQSSMEVGFKGNPNIGSVVLNQIAHSTDFEDFANAFSDGDRIFIISSIFGGTGASGFPLLLKTLRNGTDFPNHDVINKATIGAVTILPYFKLQQNDESEIDSSTFVSKTKSALAYYENNISKNGSIDALYYLADDVSKTYENHEGGSSQRNDAHLIEFLGATAIVHFSNSQFMAPANMELGIKEVGGSVSFDSFYRKMREMLYRPLVQFTMMANALTHKANTFQSASFNANKGNFDDFYSGMFYSDLEPFFHKYHEWLKEMKENKRSLDLFNATCGDKPFDLVTGVKPRKIFSKFSDYTLVIDRLNSAVRNCKSKGVENKFLEMFYLGTQKLVSEKLSN